VPELLGRSEIGLTSAGAKTNELITKHVPREGVILFIHVLCNIIHKSVFYTQSVICSL